MTKKIKDNMMRVSTEEKDDFEMNFEGESKSLQLAKQSSDNKTNNGMNMVSPTKKNDMMAEIYENEEESPSASSDDNQEEFNKEFTRSFQEKVSPKIKEAFKAINKIKGKLKKEVDRCVTNVTKDISNFKIAVRNSVREGIVNDALGDKSVKKTSDAIRSELIKIQ